MIWASLCTNQANIFINLSINGPLLTSTITETKKTRSLPIVFFSIRSYKILYQINIGGESM